MVVEEVTPEQMEEMAKRVDEFCPEGHQFIILVAPVGDAPDRRLRYASNMTRETAVNSMKEWLIKSGHGEGWMKHLN